MGFRIDTHGSRPPWSLDRLHDMEFSRHGLAGDGKGTVAATGKGVAVEFRGVYATE
jgi:hypothetical protein